MSLKNRLSTPKVPHSRVLHKHFFPPGRSTGDGISCRPAAAIILAALLWGYGAGLHARQEIKFERISFEQGLFQSNISTIFQDQRGLLWVGTSDGLNKYDGYRFSAYRFDPLDSTSISGNFIYSIYEDRQGYLWVIASGGGINRFDPGAEQFTHYRYDPQKPGCLSDDNVTAVLEDSRGNFWIGTAGGGLNLFDRVQERFFHYRPSPADPFSLSSSVIRVLHEDRQGNLWIGTDGGGLNKITLPAEPLLSGTPKVPWDHKESLPESGPQNGNPPRLRFERFYARNPTYLPEIFASLDSLANRNRRLASILHLQNFEDETEYFEIKRPAYLLAVAVGEGNAYGMTDYGWIEKISPDRVVWKMNYEKSVHLGGAARNRVEMGVLYLQPGQYKLRYRSDEQHSYQQWITEPPERPDLWGIQLFLLSGQEARNFARKLRQTINPNSLPHNWITAIHEDGDGNLWIGTADGLARLRQDATAKPGDFTVYKHDSRNPHSLNHSYVVSIYPGNGQPEEALWIITYANGLNRLDPRTGRIVRYRPGDYNAAGGEDPGAGKINVLLEDRHRNLWIGTAEGGLSCLYFNRDHRSPAETGNGRKDASGPLNTFITYRNDPLNPQSLSDNLVTAVFEDRSGIIWVGTGRGGLNKINQRHQHFRRYTHVPGNPRSLSDKVVTAIMEDDSTNLWVGTAGGGLNKLRSDPRDPSQYHYSHFRHKPGLSYSLSSDAVTALYQDQSGNVWVGTDGGGLNLLDRRTGRFKHYRYAPHSSNSISGDRINSITEDQYGQLWIGTRTGLNKFDRFTEKFTQYRHDANNPHSLSHNEVWAIYEDSYSQGKTLWIGTRAGGLNKFDRKNEQFVRYMREFDNPHSLNNPAILSIYQDKAGNLWFGTYSGGLNQFNRETEQFTFFSERDGLANNMIFGIMEDRQGNLWLSTNNGLSKMILGAGGGTPQITFKNYDVYDGLQGNEFNPGAYCLRRNGEMLFGGVNGMTAFFPDSITDNFYIPPVILTSMTIFDQPRPGMLNRALFQGLPIHLSYRENYITFEFAALDYTNPRKNHYAYRLEGFNEEWIQYGARRFASFTNLNPGKYIFRVKGSNNDGVWNELGVSVTLIIEPPFWKTWWFYLACAAALLFLTIFLHEYRVQQKLRRMREFDQVRAQENERVRAKAAHDFHDELGHKLTKISLFSEIIKRSLNGTPPEVTEYLNRIGETAKTLSGGMRDFIWTLDPEKDSLHEVAVRLKDFGDELFDKTGIAFRVEGLTREMEDICLSMDWRRHLTLIFKEAMNNALKHSHCRNVTLTISANASRLEIALADDGAGLPLFKTAGEGTGSDQEGEAPPRGNGLNNMRLRAEKLNGTIDLLPNRNGGTIVRFSGEIPQTGN